MPIPPANDRLPSPPAGEITAAAANAGQLPATPPKPDPTLIAATHGMLTSLTAILGYAEVLQSDQCSDVERFECARTIQRNGEELRAVVAEVLETIAASPAMRAALMAAPGSIDLAAAPAVSPAIEGFSRFGKPIPALPTAPIPTAPIPMPPMSIMPAVEMPPRGTSAVSIDPGSSGHHAGPVRLGGSVLVAEDSKDNSRLIAYFLRQFGVEPIIAENGRIALETAVAAAAAGEGFDLILMDIGMPEMDGITATRAIRTAGLVMPIVALTAHAMTGDRERCLAAGCTDYLTKPIERVALTKLLAKYLREGRGGSDEVTSGQSTIIPLQSNAACHRALADLPIIAGQVRELLVRNHPDSEIALGSLISALKRTALTLGLSQATSLVNIAEASIRLGADRQTIRTAIDDALACVRRTEGYVLAQESALAAA